MLRLCTVGSRTAQHRAQWATARRSGVGLEITREEITSWDHSKLGDR
jgi:hypothetical protein